eukprot:scaffold48635_cov69-Phaeocystis_antarctica.AAC.1
MQAVKSRSLKILGIEVSTSATKVRAKLTSVSGEASTRQIVPSSLSLCALSSHSGLLRVRAR